MLPESRGSIASVIPSVVGLVFSSAQRGDEVGEGIDGRLRDKIRIRIRMRFISKYVYKQGICLDDRRSFQCTKQQQQDTDSKKRI